MDDKPIHALQPENRHLAARLQALEAPDVQRAILTELILIRSLLEAALPVPQQEPDKASA